VGRSMPRPEGRQAREERGVVGYMRASPVGADGIHAISQSGKVAVLKARADWERGAVNILTEDGFATPALCGDRIIIQSVEHLWCFRGAFRTGQPTRLKPKSPVAARPNLMQKVGQKLADNRRRSYALIPGSNLPSSGKSWETGPPSVKFVDASSLWLKGKFLRSAWGPA